MGHFNARFAAEHLTAENQNFIQYKKKKGEHFWELFPKNKEDLTYLWLNIVIGTVSLIESKGTALLTTVAWNPDLCFIL